MARHDGSPIFNVMEMMAANPSPDDWGIDFDWPSAATELIVGHPAADVGPAPIPPPWFRA